MPLFSSSQPCMGRGSQLQLRELCNFYLHLRHLCGHLLLLQPHCDALFFSPQPCMGRGSRLHLQELSTAGNVEVPETCWCRLGQSRHRAFLRQPLGLAALLQKLCTAGDQKGLDRGLPPYAGWGTAETESSRRDSAG